MSFEVDFGILTEPVEYVNAHFSVHPLEDHAEVAKLFTDALNRDGFYYHGAVSQYRIPIVQGAEGEPQLIEGTTRPSHLFDLRPSHRLVVNQPIANEPATNAAAFVVYLLAYLYGTRLQLSEWQFDGRIPKLGSQHHILVHPSRAAPFVERAFAEWRSQSPEVRKRLTNLLYMHSRAPSYDWPWERFLHEYMVTDAIFDVQRRTGLCVPVRHEERIREMCGRLGVWCPTDAPVEELVRIRNDLFHAALWDDVTPGHSALAASYYKVFELRALNHRLIAATLVGGVRAYIETPWTQWQMPYFFE